MAGWSAGLGLIAFFVGIGLLIGGFVRYNQQEGGISQVTASASPTLRGNRNKICPRCAETIKVAAIACRFCGYEYPLEEVERLRSEAERGPFAEGSPFGDQELTPQSQSILNTAIENHYTFRPANGHLTVVRFGVYTATLRSNEDIINFGRERGYPHPED